MQEGTEAATLGGPEGGVEVQTGGERLWLLPARAAWWPARRTLLVADVHLGKSQAIRASGAPIPSGVLDESLSRLSSTLARTGALRLLILGDLLHAGAGVTPTLIERVAAWRRGFGGQVLVVPGNHDRAVGARVLAHLAEAWRLTIADPVLVEAGLAFQHEPGEVADRFVWAGHVHPAVRIGGGGDRVKLPCFIVGETCGILPAFSRFTAGDAGHGLGGRALAIVEGRVLDVTTGVPT